jgi:cytochrome c oxidase assembly protein subunit 11
MMAYLLLLKQSMPPTRLSMQQRHFANSSRQSNIIVVQKRNHGIVQKRNHGIVQKRNHGISRFQCRPQQRQLVSATTSRRSSSTTNNHSQPQQLKQTEKEAQKAAYDYYQRQKQEGVWNKIRNFIWPSASRKRATKTNSGSSSQQQQNQRNVNTAWYSVAVVVGALGATYAAVPLYKVFCQTTGFGGTTQRVRIIGSAETADSSSSAIVGSNIVSLVDTLFSSVTGIFQQSSSSSSSAGGSSKSRFGGARVHTWTDEEAAARLATLKPVANADLMTIRFDTTVSDVMPWSFVPVQLDVKVVPGETALSFFRVTNHSDKAITGVATYNVNPAKVGLYFQKIQCFCFEEQRLLPGETVDMPVFFFIDPEILQDPQVSYIRSITLSYTFFQTDVEDVDDDEEDAADDNQKMAHSK